jgi:hypothetical protein
VLDYLVQAKRGDSQAVRSSTSRRVLAWTWMIRQIHHPHPRRLSALVSLNPYFQPLDKRKRQMETCLPADYRNRACLAFQTHHLHEHDRAQPSKPNTDLRWAVKRQFRSTGSLSLTTMNRSGHRLATQHQRQAGNCASRMARSGQPRPIEHTSESTAVTRIV